ncbi:TRAP transporter substrate-binding protein DctP [Consotaella aegiceratis]|uniref:TRAP transporter substrate-binding protein DctP n=1 Tax=Consotaella aegiceratis TaxID=3097961 RepID=UPI002F3F8E6F
MKLLRHALVAACALAALDANAQAATYKFATNIANAGTSADLLNDFAKGVEERTEGRVTFKFFWNGVLGSQEDYLQQIQRGVVDVGLINSATLENLIPAFGVINLPYVFRTPEEYGQVMNDPKVKEILFNSAQEHRFVPLGYLSTGFRSIYTSRPVEKVEDLAGLKIRTMSSETYLEMLRSFGAVPTPLARSELFAGMQQGVVDGAEGGLAGLYDGKLGEVAKWALDTNQTRLTDFAVTSLKFRDRVSEDDLKIVYEEFEHVSAESLAIGDAHQQEAAQKAADEMGVTLVHIDTEPLMKSVEPMYEKAREDEAKRPLLDAIFEIEGREL